MKHEVSNRLNTGEALFANLRRKICIQCGSTNLKPFFAIEQEVWAAFEYWHSIISLCPDCGRGQLERAYHDAADWDETFDQTEWYLLDEASMRHLADFIEQNGFLHPSNRMLPPCPEPLSPKCLCAVHWQLTEASKRLEALNDAELRNLRGVVSSTLFLNDDEVPRFVRSDY